MTKEYTIFLNFLKARGLKLTKQRERILDCFLKTEKHITTEGLYNIVRKKDSSIGQATVFRTLKLMAEADIANQTYLGDKTVKFEHKYGHKHHDHIICVKCSKLVEAMNPEIEKLQDNLCKKFGFIPLNHRLQIFGICKNCRGGNK
jgi:Fur family ferric uptake transcriptional regulator